MTPKIKLVAIDLDGTLLNSQHQLSPRSRRALKALQAQGTALVIATGKTRFAAEPLIAELNIESPGVYLQGLMTYNPDGTVRHQVQMPKSTVRAVIALAEAQEYGVLVYSGNRVFTRQPDEVAAKMAEYGEPMAEAVSGWHILEGVQEDGEGIAVNKVIVYAAEEKIPAIRTQLNQQLHGQIHLTRANVKGLLEVLPANASKGRAVKQLMDELGIPAASAMAIGDGENDSEMLQAVGIAVAMGNAVQSLKDRADYITASNDRDGVAQALERFAINKMEQAQEQAQ